MGKQAEITKVLNELVTELVKEYNEAGDVMHIPKGKEESEGVLETSKEEYIAFKLVGISAVNRLTRGDFQYVKSELEKQGIKL